MQKLLGTLFLLGLPLLTLAQGTAAATPKPAADSTQLLRSPQGEVRGRYNLPQLVGVYMDDLGKCKLELFANGQGAITYLKGGKPTTTQHVRWGVRLGADGTMAMFRDEEGLDTYEVVMEHLSGERLFNTLSLNFSPDLTTKTGLPYLVEYTREWMLAKQTK